MIKISCCRNCVPPKRHVGCHATCPDYIQGREIRNAELDEQYKRRRASRDVEDLTMVAVTRIKKRNIRRK